MAEVTVNQLAETVGTPVERLLKQMKEAGLSHNEPTERVSEEDKKTLLVFLQNTHGAATTEPSKITLKRKTISTLKAPSSQGRKTVSVEVRKKRTYVKRDPSELGADAHAEGEIDVDLLDDITEAVVETAPVAEAAVVVEEQPEVVVAPEIVAEPSVEPAVVEAKAAVEAKVAAESHAEVQRAPEARPAEVRHEPARPHVTGRLKAPRETLERKEITDPELIRQAAIVKRKELEAREKSEREAMLRAREEQQRKAREPAAAAAPRPAGAAEPAAAAADDAKKATKHKKREDVRERGVGGSGSFEDDDRQKKGRAVKERGAAVATLRGKPRAQALSIGDDEFEEGGRFRRRKKHKDQRQHGFEKPTEAIVREVELGEAITVGDLAAKMSVKSVEVVKELMKLGVMATINQVIDQDTASLVIGELGHKVKLVSSTAVEDNLLDEFKRREGTQLKRAPVVTVMGHVDHGKTSLLDYIRKTRVASGEAGGITQHIGAYHVETGHGVVTFLDTPGHAAFTAMRARGAKATDVVILVVAADDGVMPQTIEAVQHARAANVPIVVAVNKIDKEAADPERVRSELSQHGVISEAWGGDTQFVEVSAHTGQGISDLLDAILLQAEVLELKAAADVPASGVVVESRLDKGRGVVATVLVQNGTLRQGDIVLVGRHYGRVRALLDESSRQVPEAGPSIPVEILGLDGTPEAGEEFFVIENEKRAREISEFRDRVARETRMARQGAAKLDAMFANMASGGKKSLNVVLKTDVRGSLEALQAALRDIGNDEVEVTVVSAGVGAITESDVNLALTASAVVFGFNVRADSTARQLVEREGVDMRYYSVIYDLIDDVKQALSGLLAPELREEIVGIAEVRDVFRSPKFGAIAGCMVIEGTVARNKRIRVLRDNVVIYEGELESLRRFKDDVNEVRNGFECGIGVKNYNDVRPGDKIEVFDMRQIARSI
jgi:translation initiation factor IF-2